MRLNSVFTENKHHRFLIYNLFYLYVIFFIRLSCAVRPIWHSLAFIQHTPTFPLAVVCLHSMAYFLVCSRLFVSVYVLKIIINNEHYWNERSFFILFFFCFYFCVCKKERITKIPIYVCCTHNTSRSSILEDICANVRLLYVEIARRRMVCAKNCLDDKSPNVCVGEWWDCLFSVSLLLFGFRQHTNPNENGIIQNQLKR